MGGPGATARNRSCCWRCCARCGARPLLLGYRVHTLLCRASGLPLLFLLAPANGHDAPFAQPLLTWAVRLYGLRPRVIRLDAGYWGLRLIAWIHTTLGAIAVIPWNAKRQKNRSCLPPTWTADELGKRTGIERFFGRVFSLFSLFRLQCPPLAGWSAVACRVALTYAAEKQQLELEYVRRRSFGFDLYVLAATCWAFVASTGNIKLRGKPAV